MRLLELPSFGSSSTLIPEGALPSPSVLPRACTLLVSLRRPGLTSCTPLRESWQNKRKAKEGQNMEV